MADETNSGLAFPESTCLIPIAQLSPLLKSPSSTSLKAIVTLTWPYSSVTSSVAFLLAEPDFRLRRTRGQVRVQFSASSARAVAQSGIASGDEVVLSLEGVEWINDQSTVSTPGKGVEFELRFKERLLLQFRQEDSENYTLIDIDHPSQPDPQNDMSAENSSPQHTTLHEVVATVPSTEASIEDFAKSSHEWSSPAFIKRARTSYGSMFDAGYDPFAEEDGTIRGKGRKRMRLSSTWRFTSRSSSPESMESAEMTPNDDSHEATVFTKPIMLDEGCQTVAMELGDAAEVLASFSRQDVNVGSSSFEGTNGILGLPDDNHRPDTAVTALQEISVPLKAIHVPVNAVATEPVNDPADYFPTKASDLPSTQGLNSPLGHGVADLAPSSAAVEDVDLRRSSAVLEHLLAGSVEISEEAVPTYEREDLYNASPIRRRSEPSALRFEALKKSPSPGHKRVEDLSPLEDQYGHWQAKNFLTSSAVSPNRLTDFSATFEAHSEVSHHSSPAANTPGDNTDAKFLLNYAEAEEVSIHYGTPFWEYTTTTTRYPDLPDPSDWHGAEPAAPNAIAGGFGMSRSQSAQSAVFDLTETDDEEDDEQGDLDQESDVQGDQVSEDAESAAGEAPGVRWNTSRENDVSEGSQIEGESHSGGFDVDIGFRNSPTYSRHSFASDDDEAEGKYNDEDMEYEEEFSNSPTPRASQPPVVIDLLSSDEEDEDQDAASKPKSSSDSRHGPNTEESEASDSEESGEDEGNAGSSSFPSVEQQKFRSQIVHYATESSPPGDEESVEDEDGGNSLSEAHRSSSPQDGSPAASDIRDTASEAEAACDGNDDHGLRNPSESDTGETREYGEEPEKNFTGQYMMSALEHIAQQALRPPPIYDHRFSLDGTNDRKTEGISYPALPTEENSTPPPTAPKDSSQSQVSIKERPVPREMPQLPTPDTTQIIEYMVADSQTDSFRSTTSFLQESSQISFHKTTDEHTPAVQQENFGEDLSPQLPSADTITINEEASQPNNRISLTTKAQEGVTAIDEEPAQVKAVDDSSMNKGFSGRQDQVTASEESKAVGKPGTYGQNEENEGFHGPRPSADRTLPFVNLPSGARPVDKDGASWNIGGVAMTYNEMMSMAFTGLPPPAVGQAVKLHSTGHDVVLMIEDEGRESDEPDVGQDDEDEGSEDDEDQDSENDIVEDGELGEDENSVNVMAHRKEPGVEHRKVSSPVEVATAELSSEAQNGTEEPQEPAATPQQDVLASPPQNQSIEKPTVTVEVQIPARQVTPEEFGSDKAAVEDESPLILDSQSTPEGHDASIELALDSLNSPSKHHRELRKPPVIDIKLRLLRFLRNELRQFTSLKVLRYHLGKKLDVLAIVMSTPFEPERAKSGPRHYSITFNITDPSIAPSGVSQVQIFRPYKAALPVVQAGDGILLRAFEVISVKNKGFCLRSDDPSSWAVFKDEGEVEIRGPPVELEGGETKYANDMKTWYNGLDATALAKLERANALKVMAGV